MMALIHIIQIAAHETLLYFGCIILLQFLTVQMVFRPNLLATGWEEAWKKGIKPWDAGKSAPALVELLEKNRIPEGKALVPGCGTVSPSYPKSSILSLTY